MTNANTFEVIIIGGSYAGLSAALALGRSLRKVLIIDSGKPCNRFTPHSHNFLTHDGHTPQFIASQARQEVAQYPTVTWLEGVATRAEKTDGGFEVEILSGDRFFAKKLILATGLRDIMPEIEGFADCWGRSVIHCPYCHGYEVSKEKTAIISNGEAGFHYARLISNWTDDLRLLTNGSATFTDEQWLRIRRNNIEVIETEIAEIVHTNGQVEGVVFRDGMRVAVRAIYSGPAFEQHSAIYAPLGVRLTDQGLIEVDAHQKTSVDGVFACGDNCGMRVISMAVSSGTKAGAVANFDLIEEAF